MENWVIRGAAPEDFEGVRALEELDFSFHAQARPDYFRELQCSYTREEFEILLAHPCPIALVAVEKETIAGLCFGTLEDSPGNSVCRPRRFALIQDLVTLPEYRGRGIATAPLARAREQAVQAGAVSLELCAWAFNERALRLYEKAGLKVQYYRMEMDLRNG